MNLHKLRQRRDQIREFQYIETAPIEKIQIREAMEHEGYEKAVKQKDFKPCTVGREWGKPWSTAWFKMRCRVPASFKGLPVAARIDTGGQAVAYLDGTPLQGLDENHKEIRLLDRAKGGEVFDFVVETGAQGSFGHYGVRPRLSRAELASVDEEMRSFFWDYDALLEVLHVVPENSRRRALMLRGMNRAIDRLLVDGFEPEHARKNAKAARAILKPLLAQPASASESTLSLIGHAHIDVAWLWPLQETVRKCSRTFSTVCKYMEEYPHYKFGQSQVQLYEFTKKHYPELYEKIRKWAKKGRWEVVAGMWVEPDMNIAGAEALVRQILLAKEFTRREFGYETDVLWLPDVFGYSAALPQVLKKGGIDYFATIKLFWNETNKPPYQSFWWEGIDGTRVLAHFPPNGDYNATINGERLRTSADRYNEKDRTDVVLFPFGHGDGGGGPALEHMERSARYENLEGLPKTRMQFITDFFHDLEERSEDLPEWKGELYLETHRGTYTTQTENKRNNRKSELLYREAEFAASIAHALGAEYPREKLNNGWRLILLNQFHDILPGSSIGWVYKDSQDQYRQILKTGAEVRDTALGSLAAQVNPGGEGIPILLSNSLPWNRSEIVSIEAPTKDGNRVEGPEGPVETERVGKQLRFKAEVPSMGYAVYRVLPEKTEKIEKPRVTATENRIESDLYRIRFAPNGLIRSILDKKAGREVLAPGAFGNIFQRFLDRPTNFDAWNIDEDALDTAVEITGLVSAEAFQDGANRAGVRQVRKFGKSVITQEIVLEAGSPLIRFDTVVDWHESWQLLKVAFPVDVHTDFATFEIQFGHVRRPTHRNTSWDRARFETCAHKWVDLSQPDYGVALINESKFGHDIVDNTIRLTLLKSPKEPDENADMGRQEFSYALMPHLGDFREAEVIRRAYEFNIPLSRIPMKPGKGALPSQKSFVSVDVPGVMIEALKVEEEGSRWILRCYECFGQRSQVTVRLGVDIREVAECDLLERGDAPVKHSTNTFTFETKPFEIRTFAVRVG